MHGNCRWQGLIKARIAASNPFLVFIPWTRCRVLSLSARDRFGRAAAVLKTLIFQEIHQRHSNAVAPGKGKDILSHLVDARHDDGTGLTDQQIRDQLITLLLAGHDTTASATPWVMHWIHRDPDVLERLQQELRTGTVSSEEIAANAYLEEMCNETLRLSPLIPDVVRCLKTRFTLGAHELPAGINIGVCTSLIHMNSDVYEQSDRFNPERLIGQRYRSHEFVPFGGGIRKCIGASFAVEEMKIILGMLIVGANFQHESKQHR